MSQICNNNVTISLIYSNLSISHINNIVIKSHILNKRLSLSHIYVNVTISHICCNNIIVHGLMFHINNNTVTMCQWLSSMTTFQINNSNYNAVNLQSKIQFLHTMT